MKLIRISNTNAVVFVGLIVAVFSLAVIVGRSPSSASRTTARANLAPQELSGKRENMRVMGQTVDPTYDPPEAYPGGDTPEPVPTQTDIPPSEGKYVGWTGEQIANDLIARYENATPPRAIPPTEHIDSREITPADAEPFGLEASAISFQSPTDYAVVLKGAFPHLLPGTFATPIPDAPYMLVLVDTYSGAVRKFKFAEDVQVLLDLLP